MATQPTPTAPQYTIEPEWQATPRARSGVRRIVEAREGPSEPGFDAAALTAALGLTAKPVSNRLARKVAATYAMPYDILTARIGRRSKSSSGGSGSSS